MRNESQKSFGRGVQNQVDVWKEEEEKKKEKEKWRTAPDLMMKRF